VVRVGSVTVAADFQVFGKDGDPAVAELRQMPGGQHPADIVVDHDGIDRRRGVLASDQDERNRFRLKTR